MTAPRTRRPSARPAGYAATLLIGLAALAGLSACGSGQITQTATQVAPVGGANVNIGPGGSIQLRNVMIAYPDTAGYPVGASAPLVVRIFNNGSTTVTLVGVEATDVAERVLVLGGTEPVVPTTSAPSASASASTSAGANRSANPAASASATASPTPTPTVAPRAVGQERISVAVPAGGYALLVPGQGRYLQLSGLTKALLPGESVALTFRFSDGTTATVPVPVGLPTGSVPRGTAAVDEGNPEG